MRVWFWFVFLFNINKGGGFEFISEYVSLLKLSNKIMKTSSTRNIVEIWRRSLK